MDIYIAAEHRLATLLGWVRQPEGHWHSKTAPISWYVPQWARDWSACGQLMVAHGCYPKEIWLSSVIEIRCPGWPEGFRVRVKDHPTKDAAIRYAIVMAVIDKLERDQSRLGGDLYGLPLVALGQSAAVCV